MFRVKQLISNKITRESKSKKAMYSGEFMLNIDRYLNVYLWSTVYVFVCSDSYSLGRAIIKL